MKPIPIPEYVDLWVLVNLDQMMNLYLFTDVHSRLNTYKTELEAQQAQLLQALSGNFYQVYHIQWPTKTK
jgi:hypothetical protein